MTFLDDSENFWGELEKKEKKESETENGRFILYRYKCPLCGSIKGCGVKKGNKEGFPVLYCKTYDKWVECVYKFK